LYRSGSSPYVSLIYPFSGVIQSISFVCLSGADSIGTWEIIVAKGPPDGGAFWSFVFGVVDVYERPEVMQPA